MTTVYLHVGMPKCASTALQSFPHRNSDLHRSEGLCYPEAYRAASGYFSHAPLLRIRPSAVPAAIGRIAAEARDSNCDRLLISSEVFIASILNRNMFKQVIAALNEHFGAANVRLLILFRNHFPFVESVYAQFLRAGMFGMPSDKITDAQAYSISEFTSRFRERNGFDLFSYTDFIERLRIYAPENPFDCLSIERADRGGQDIIDHLCHRLGVSRGVVESTPNRRYSDEALYLLHYSRERYGVARTKQHRSILARLFPPGDRAFSKLLHVNGALFDRLAEASERDRHYFSSNAIESCQSLFIIPDGYQSQRDQEDQLSVPGWHMQLVDRVMQSDDMSLRQAEALKAWMQTMSGIGGP